MQRALFLCIVLCVSVLGCAHEKANPMASAPQAAVAGSYPAVIADPIPECRAAILVYHHVNPHSAGETPPLRAMTVSHVAFAAQMQHLFDAKYAVVSLDAVTDCLTSSVPLPEKAVVITLDDGWSSQYVYALPILEKHHFTATFFVVTNLVLERDGGGLLSWPQVKDLDKRGMTIGSHSKTHPNLTLLSDAQLKDEVSGSKKTLEDRLSKPARHFAYPFGFVNDRVVAAVRGAGYVSARGTVDGTHQQARDLYTLKVVYVTDDFKMFARNIAQ